MPVELPYKPFDGVIEGNKRSYFLALAKKDIKASIGALVHSGFAQYFNAYLEHRDHKTEILISVDALAKQIADKSKGVIVKGYMLHPGWFRIVFAQMAIQAAEEIGQDADIRDKTVVSFNKLGWIKDYNVSVNPEYHKECIPYDIDYNRGDGEPRGHVHVLLIPLAKFSEGLIVRNKRTGNQFHLIEFKCGKWTMENEYFRHKYYRTPFDLEKYYDPVYSY